MKSSTVQRVLAVLTALALAAPAAAAADNARAAQANGQATAPASHPDRMICVRTELTGSRLLRRVCRTAAEWAEDGEVPEAR